MFHVVERCTLDQTNYHLPIAMFSCALDLYNAAVQYAAVLVAIWKHAAVLVFRSLQCTTVINVDCSASVVLIANLNLNRLQPDPPLSPPSFHALTLVT